MDGLTLGLEDSFFAVMETLMLGVTHLLLHNVAIFFVAGGKGKKSLGKARTDFPVQTNYTVSNYGSVTRLMFLLSSQ